MAIVPRNQDGPRQLHRFSFCGVPPERVPVARCQTSGATRPWCGRSSAASSPRARSELHASEKDGGVPELAFHEFKEPTEILLTSSRGISGCSGPKPALHACAGLAGAVRPSSATPMVWTRARTAPRPPSAGRSRGKRSAQGHSYLADTNRVYRRPPISSLASLIIHRVCSSAPKRIPNEFWAWLLAGA